MTKGQQEGAGEKNKTKQKTELEILSRYSRCSQMKDHSSNNTGAVSSIKLPLLSLHFHFLHHL